MEYKNIDERELFRRLGSRNALISTRQVNDLQTKVVDWIQTNSCGGIVYGPSRCGKTCAIHYISQSLKDIYGTELPVYCFTATAHIPTQKAFYESMLFMLDHEQPSRGTANQMRQRLVNRIVANALETPYRMAVLWIDEAYLLNENEYLWLIDIYNALAINDILLTVILVGTKELLDVKKGFIASSKQQIIQRFMLKEATFHGIESITDLFVCMKALDSSVTLVGNNEPICLSQYFFPDAYRNGIELASCSDDLWKAKEILREKYRISADFLTMKCFVDSISYCLRKFGVSSNTKLYQPGVTEWITALSESGYVSSQV